MPPKGKGTAVPKEAFLFVNEDFSTLFGGAKNAELDRTKQSHVQRQSFAKRLKSKKGETDSTSKSPTASDSGRSPTDSGAGPSNLWLPSETSLNPQVSFTESLWPPFRKAEVAQAKALSLTTQHEGEPWFSSSSTNRIQYPADPSMAEHLQTRHQLPSTNPSTYELSPSSMNGPLLQPSDPYRSYRLPMTPVVDPFINFQAALETWAPPLMRYFTLVMMPEYFYSELKAVSLHEMRHVEELHADMRSCMSCPAEMYALLAASASHSMSRVGHLDLPGLAPQDYDRVALVLTSKSFEALRHRLANGTLARSTVIATQRVVCAALYTSAFPAVEAHHKAVLSMIEQMGGLQTFNDYEKERLIMQNLYYALRTLRAPEFELTWDPGSFHNNARSGVLSSMTQESTSIGSQIGEMVENENTALHPLLAQIMVDLVEIQQVLSWLRTQQYRPAEYRWLLQRRLAIMHRILSLHPETGTNHSELVRMALICFIVLSRVLPWSESLLHVHYIAPALRTWAANTMEEAFAVCPELLLWMMVMFGIELMPQGAEAYDTESTGLADVANLTTDVGKRSCTNLGIVTESQLTATLQKMLFDDEILDKRYLSFCKHRLGLEMSE